MARNESRVFTRIWDDEEFVALDPGSQRLYLFLLSQKDLAFTGVLPLRPARWAKKAKRLTVAVVARELAVLAEGRFTVVDEGTGEVLIRTFVRNDGVWRQPNLMVKMGEEARTIESPAIWAALRAELSMLDVSVLSEELPKQRGQRPPKSPRTVVTEVLAALGVSVGPTGTPKTTPTDTPTGRDTGSPAPSPNGSHPQGDAETHLTGDQEALPVGVRHVRPRDQVRADLSSPPLLPVLPVPPSAGGAAAAPGSDLVPVSRPVTAQTLLAEWIDHCPKPPPDRVRGQLAKHLGALFAQGIAPEDIRAGLALWHTKNLHPASLDSVVHEAMNASNRPVKTRQQEAGDAQLARQLERARAREAVGQ